MNINRQTVQLSIIGLMAVVSFGLVVFDAVTGRQDPPVLETLLGVVLGFIGSNTSSQQGANQALLQPPKTNESPQSSEKPTTTP